MHKQCPVIVAGIGFFFLVTGIICAWYAFPKLADSQVKKEIELVEGSNGWKFWKKQPIPLKFKIYFFNVSNTEEVQQGASPVVKEIGPYVYDEYREKVRIKISGPNDTVEYYERKTYFFNEEDSACRTQDDFLTIVNPVLVSTALKTEIMMASALSTMNDALPYLFPGIKDMFMRGRVKDILFNGMLLSCSDATVEFICNALKSVLPETVRAHPNKKDYLFSVFHHLNNTEEGPYVIERGNVKNTSKANILQWHGVKVQNRWFGDACNTINGTDGSTFPPVTSNVKRIYVFSPDFCRSLYVDKEREETWKGLPTIRYSNPESALDQSKDNECFCPRVKDDDYNDVMVCTPKGTFDIYPCITVPLLISFPHFYLGDEKLLKWVAGLKPDKKKHETFLNLEPMTGTPLIGHKRVQFNVQIKNFKDYGFEVMSNVSEGIFPFLWLDEGVELTPELLAQVEAGYMGLKLLSIMKWIMILTGLGLMAASLLIVMNKERILCCSKMGSAKITQLQTQKRPPRSHLDFENGENGAEMSFNTSVVYPGTYAQNNPSAIINGINPNLVRRPQPQYQFAEGAWSFKN